MSRDGRLQYGIVLVEVGSLAEPEMMEALIPFLCVALVMVGVPLGYAIGQYNGMVALRNHIAEAWSNVDTELKRRYELIPNLVQTVKAYAKHEREILERVVELRQKAMASRGDVAFQSYNEQQLTDGMTNLLAVAESYPELQANQNFLQLQNELVNTEDRIQAARRFYNGNVRDYRNKREAFPSSLIAQMFNFGPLDFFEVDPAVRENVKVNLQQ